MRSEDTIKVQQGTTRGWQPKRDVLSDGERFHKHKVLVDHADAVFDGVGWRG